EGGVPLGVRAERPFGGARRGRRVRLSRASGPPGHRLCEAVSDLGDAGRSRREVRRADSGHQGRVVHPLVGSAVINWVGVDEAALRNNVAEFKRRLGPEPKLGAVVKSNAYGHGLVEVARIAADAGADWLCVNNVDEGAALRDAGASSPVLIMGYVPLD